MEEKGPGWYTLHVHAPGDPPQNGGIRYTRSFTFHITVCMYAGALGQVTMENMTGCYGGEVSACVHNVYQALSPPPFKGPGYVAYRQVLRCLQVNRLFAVKIE